MEELAFLRAKPQLGGAPSPALLVEGFLVMSDPVITTQAHLAYAGARLHSNNAAELSSIIEALSFLGSNGPVACDSQACIFCDSRHAASICLGTVQSRANVSSGLTCQCLLLQVPLRSRFTMQRTVMRRIPGTSVQTMLPLLVHLVLCRIQTCALVGGTLRSIPLRCLRHVTTLMTPCKFDAMPERHIRLSTTSGQKLAVCFAPCLCVVCLCLSCCSSI